MSNIKIYPFLTLQLGAKFREVLEISQLLQDNDHSLSPITQLLHGFGYVISYPKGNIGP